MRRFATASVLEEDGCGVAILDCDPRDLGPEAALEEVVREAPDMVAMDSSSTSLDQDLALARSIRTALDLPVAILGSEKFKKLMLQSTPMK